MFYFLRIISCNTKPLSILLNGYLLELAMARFESALEAESKAVRFGDVVALEDSKRIPLNSRDRKARKGPYPYYGATSVMDHVDDYLFDDVRVLLGEDGTVVDSEGKPILQYVWGKYWVNNHAHILAPSGEYSLEAIYVALRRTAINHIITGAVQMKISQRNLKSLELEMPSPESLDYLQDLFAVYRSNQNESVKLASLRDSLLPKLMSDEIDVSKVGFMQLNSHLAKRWCVLLQIQGRPYIPATPATPATQECDETMKVLYFLELGTTLGPPRGPLIEKGHKHKPVTWCFWSRGPDLNQRPSGYEPDELPDCSTPHYVAHAQTNNVLFLVRMNSIHI